MPNNNEATALPSLEEADAIYLTEPHFEAPHRAIDPDNPSWGVGSALLVWIASIVLMFVVQLIFVIPYVAMKGLKAFDPLDKTAVLLQVAALLPIHILTFFLVWALVTRLGKHSFWEALGLGWARGFRLWSCIGLGVLLFIIASVVAKWLGSETPTQLEQIINSSYAARFAISFLAVCTAPFVEEFIYRGVLYSALRRGVGTLGAWVLALFAVKLEPNSRERLGVSGAVILVLLLFTIIHVPQYWPNFGVIAAVGILSLVLTVVRAYSGKLLPCVVIHLVFNGIQAVILLVEPYAQRFLPSSPSAPDPAAILLPLIGFLN